MTASPNTMMHSLKYRTGLKRIWAAIVDWIVFLPLLLVGQWIHKSTNNISIVFVWVTFLLCDPFIYSVILHYKWGQTIGKWVAGVKVVDITESRNLSLTQSIYRDGFYLIVAFIGLLYYSFLLAGTDDADATISSYYLFSNDPFFWWSLIELVSMLTNSKRRGVHDLIARSVVVRTETSR
jgi:uncharacterized RDD family membrane protein YckC